RVRGCCTASAIVTVPFVVSLDPALMHETVVCAAGARAQRVVTQQPRTRWLDEHVGDGGLFRELFALRPGIDTDIPTDVDLGLLYGASKLKKAASMTVHDEYKGRQPPLT